MDTLTLLLQLFGTFFLIGAFTIGGGYAMLSLIQGEVVTAHHWISESTFTDIVAISQMTPGWASWVRRQRRSPSSSPPLSSCC